MTLSESLYYYFGQYVEAPLLAIFENVEPFNVGLIFSGVMVVLVFLGVRVFLAAAVVGMLGLVAIIGLLGYTLSLGANLWGNVDRKRRDLAVLRVVGFRTGDIIWVPVLQALYTAILGWGLAVAVYFLVGKAINAVMAGQLSSGQTVCKLEPWHFVAAFVLTMLAAVLSAMLAGYRASRIEPADGLRDI